MGSIKENGWLTNQVAYIIYKGQIEKVFVRKGELIGLAFGNDDLYSFILLLIDRNVNITYYSDGSDIFTDRESCLQRLIDRGKNG